MKRSASTRKNSMPAARPKPTLAQRLDSLAEHPYNRQLRVTAGGLLQRRISPANRWVSLAGLVDNIQVAFYPQYDYSKSVAVAKRRKWQPNKQPAPANEFFLMWRQNARLAGQTLGAMIDREWESVIRGIAQRKVHLTTQNINAMQVSPYTRELLHFHRRNGWQPLFGQFAVFDPALGVGTRIDEICFDSNGNLIIVELKYGYDKYREFGNAVMDGPLSDCLDSPQHQHMMQCGIAAIMLELHWKVKVDAGFVIYVTDGEVHPVPVGDWFWARKKQIWAHFCAVMNRRVK